MAKVRSIAAGDGHRAAMPRARDHRKPADRREQRCRGRCSTRSMRWASPSASTISAPATRRSPISSASRCDTVKIDRTFVTRSRRRRRFGGHSVRHHRHGARVAAAGRRGRGGDRKAGGDSRPPRLRSHPGVLLQPAVDRADARRVRQSDGERGAATDRLAQARGAGDSDSTSPRSTGTWCPGPESNRHGAVKRPRILSPLCLPVSPPGPACSEPRAAPTKRRSAGKHGGQRSRMLANCALARRLLVARYRRLIRFAVTFPPGL